MEIDLRGGIVQAHETHSVEPVNAKDVNVFNCGMSGKPKDKVTSLPSEGLSTEGLIPARVVSRKSYYN
jgi:hypothetical protein